MLDKAFNPVTATFTVPNINQPVDFTLQAQARRGGVLIRAQCGTVGTEPAFSKNAPDVSFWLPTKVAAGISSLIEYWREPNEVKQREPGPSGS